MEVAMVQGHEQQTLVTEINDILDRIRVEAQVTSDVALAEKLGVTDVTIYRWRKGLQISKSTRVLLPYAVKFCGRKANAEPAAA